MCPCRKREDTAKRGWIGQVEGIRQSERRKSSLSDKIAVDEVLQLLGGLLGGAGVCVCVCGCVSDIIIHFQIKLKN